MAALLFFGRFSDVAENQNLPLPETVTNTEGLTDFLSGKYPEFSELMKRPGTQIAVNKTLIQSPVPITDADEIAYMSALSGG